MGLAAALWGYVGIFVLFGSAIVRLFDVVLQGLQAPLAWYHWVALAFSLGFMGFAEGYRGFQKAFSPRVAARLFHLSKAPTFLHTLLAPLFAMGFFHTTRRRQITSFVLVVGIFLLVQLVHLLPQPWRGIVDAGVVLGLVWGLVSLSLFSAQAWLKGECKHSPELP
ncbi:MAG: hypothetical protein ACPGPF_00495 [Pontibacterium sp.]